MQAGGFWRALDDVLEIPLDIPMASRRVVVGLVSGFVQPVVSTGRQSPTIPRVHPSTGQYEAPVPPTFGCHLLGRKVET